MTTLLIPALLLLLLSLSLVPARRAAAAGDWHFADRHFRAPIAVEANGYARTDIPAEVEINFTTLLAGVNQSGALDLNSIRVVEVDANGQVIDSSVSFQFDPGANYNASTKAQGTLIILLEGNTGASETRRYHAYFDVSGNFDPANVTPLVSLTDDVQDAGFASYRIATPRTTYFYHKQGGGFSSVLDVNNNDWISYSTAEGAAGDYRGIPNMVAPRDGGYFHPGRLTSTSVIVNQGPLKATIRSTSDGGLWQTQWELFPTYARMTVVKAPADKKYWFLYEGTPGGVLQVNTDFVVRSNGTQTALATSWTGDLQGEEWAFFADPNVGRALYVVHHQEDGVVDSYWPMQNLMTVFGFGRDGLNTYLTQTQRQFTFGLVDATTLNGVAPVVRAAYKPMNTNVGAAEKNGDPPPPPPVEADVYVSLRNGGAINQTPAVSFADEDVLLYNGVSGTWSLFFDGSANGLPTTADVDGFAVQDGELFLSLESPATIPGLGQVDDSDVVGFAGGIFRMMLDGSLYGLTTSYEDVDAIAFDADGRLLVSTMGAYTVPGLSGGDEDLIRFNQAGGSWDLYFDGSDVNLKGEDVFGAWVDATSGDVYLNVLGAYSLPGVAGDGADIFQCRNAQTGPDTACTYRAFWDSSPFGFAQLDAIEVNLP